MNVFNIHHCTAICNFLPACPTFTLVLKTDSPGMFLFDYFSPDPAGLGSLESDDVATSLDLNIQTNNQSGLATPLSPLPASN